MTGLVYTILKGHEVAQALYGKPGGALWSFAPVTIYLFVLTGGFLFVFTG